MVEYAILSSHSSYLHLWQGFNKISPPARYTPGVSTLSFPFCSSSGATDHLDLASQQVEGLWVGPFRERGRFMRTMPFYMYKMQILPCGLPWRSSTSLGTTRVSTSTGQNLYSFLLTQATAENTPVLWVDNFKYLGIHIQRDPGKFYDLNLHPLLVQLHNRCSSWGILPLNLLLI